VQPSDEAATHTQGKPFGCKRCPLRFRTDSDLQRHRVVHSGQRLHKCTKCGNTFSRADGLAAHNRSATRCSACALPKTGSNTMESLRQAQSSHGAITSAPAPHSNGSGAGQAGLQTPLIESAPGITRTASTELPVRADAATPNILDEDRTLRDNLTSQGPPAWLLEPLSPTQPLTPDDGYTVSQF